MKSTSQLALQHSHAAVGAILGTICRSGVLLWPVFLPDLTEKKS